MFSDLHTPGETEGLRSKCRPFSGHLLSAALNFTRGQKHSPHLHPTDLLFPVDEEGCNWLIVRVNAAGAVPCPQVSPVHKLSCSSLALSKDARYLLTAGDKVIKVWDYQMRFSINFQVLHLGREGGCCSPDPSDKAFLNPWRRKWQMCGLGQCV